jgi:protein SCO1
MNTHTFLRRTLACGALALSALTTAAPLPASSLYRLDVPLTDNTGTRFAWRELAGKPALVTMFYGDCNTACPIIIENLRRTVVALGPQSRGLRILMVSLDPIHDTPAALAAMMKQERLDPAIFRVAFAENESHTRAMAGVLQIKYRALDGGTINHTARLTLLDAGGSVLAASEKLDPVPDPLFLARIRAALRP